MESLNFLIANAQAGNKEACLKLISQFNPIIRKYSRKLNYDGSDTDLIIWFIKTILNMKIVNPGSKP